MFMARVTALALVLILSGPAAQEPTSHPWEREFPQQDVPIVWRLNAAARAADAAARLSRAPAEVETVRALVAAEDHDGLLQSLRLIIDEHPSRMAAALEAVGGSVFSFRGDTEQARRRVEALQQIVADGRRRLASLHIEEAARAERVFVTVDGTLSSGRLDMARHLRPFVDRYRGTEAGLLAEVDVIMAQGASPQMIEALDAFAARHPGTTAAAKAIYQKGFQYESGNMLRHEPRGADPIQRFERVQAAARELESGRYPESEWTRKAPSLIGRFFIPRDATIPDGSLDRLIASFEAFARTYISRASERDVVSYVITSKLPELYSLREDRTAGFERLLASLERSDEARAAVQHFRGSYYMQARDRETTEERHARLAKAKSAFRAAADEGDSAPHRRALATLASIEFNEGECAASLRTLREYVDRYPQTAWSWVALIRTGQCEETLGNLDAAIAAFRLAAETGTDVPPAQVIGRAYAGRLLEATGAIEAARDEYAQALDAWDPRFGPRYSTYVRLRPSRSSPFGIAPEAAEITSASLAQRVSHLTQALARPGGVLLAQARAHLERGDYERAVAAAARFLTEHPTSDLSADARYVAHLARLEHALVLADTERPGHDIARAEEMLDALAREPHDFAVSAARIARATMRRLRGGDATAQEREVKAALEELHARQQPQEPADGIEADIVAIRRAVFLPRGGGVYGAERWNAFKWSDATTPFFILSADLSVKRHDGEVQRFTLAHPLPAAPEALFLERDQIDLLERMIVSLGGTKRAEPTHIMQTPNQPVGGAREIVMFWNRFFPARQGHWVGWELEAYPRITEIHFTNAERTKASVRVTIGYSGGTVELDKEGGQWKARRLVGRWIT
jgi:outer membrane protein assembly factor BamD (BamD/ComL family)